MKSFIVYLPSGQIVRNGVCQDETLETQAFDGEFVMESEARCDTHYVADGEVLPLPPKQDGEFVFDYNTIQWVFDESTAIQKALSKRDQLLKDGPDRISPIWWEAMTQEQQQAWSDYRKALLDITDQPGYPLQINWPTAPGQE